MPPERIRIERGFGDLAQRGLGKAPLPPPVTPPPRRRPPSKIWMGVAAGLVVTLGVLAGIVLATRRSAARTTLPSDLPDWAATSGAPAVVLDGDHTSATPPAIAAGAHTPSRPGRWRSRDCTLGPNRALSADFGQASDGPPRSWTADRPPPAGTWSVLPTNSPFTGFGAANGRAAAFVVPRTAAKAQPAFRTALERVVRNGTARCERVLFAWDMRLEGGADEWTFEDRAHGETGAFSMKAGRDAVVLDDLAFTAAPLASNAWYHVELYVDYTDGAGGVDGSLYDAAGQEIKHWLRLPQAAFKARKQRATGCDALALKAVPHGGGRTLLLDNIYVGVCLPNNPPK